MTLLKMVAVRLHCFMPPSPVQKFKTSHFIGLLAKNLIQNHPKKYISLDREHAGPKFTD
jgi:hypothetical protein